MEGQLAIKGYNYITTTQIHLDLQNFFNKNLDKVKEEEIDFNKIKTISARLIKKNEKNENNKSEFNYMNDRLYQHEVFQPLIKLCKPGECFQQNDHQNFLNQVLENIKFILKRKQIQNFLSGDPQDYITIKNPIYFLTMERILETNDSEFIKIFKDDPQNYQRIHMSIIKIFSEYMEHFFNVVDKPKFLYEVNYSIPYYHESPLKQNIQVSIFKTVLKLKESDNTFVLIYGKYEYKNCSRNENQEYILEEDPKPYKIILNLLKTENHITKYGFYDHYIDSGIYVYKMFDYTRPKQVIYPKNQIDGNYAFIGDLLTNMWPLKDPLLQ